MIFRWLSALKDGLAGTMVCGIQALSEENILTREPQGTAASTLPASTGVQFGLLACSPAGQS